MFAEAQDGGLTDVTDGPSQGGCATLLEGEFLLQPISMLTPLVSTCYHALIHSLVIEVTRRHICCCWLIKGTESPTVWRVSARHDRMTLVGVQMSGYASTEHTTKSLSTYS